MKRRHTRLMLASIVLVGWLTGCTSQASYMRGWTLAEGIDNRWTGGTFAPQKLSPDEAAVYQELGAPEVVRFFRTLDTRQQAYEWIYLKREQTVWFVEGQRVEYVAVDADTSPLTKEQRETMQDKLTTGGIVAGVIGGVAAGSLLLGNTLGLR